MIDIIVGIAVFLFIVLGLREGLVKSLVSVGIVFGALFIAAYALTYLSKEAPQFGDPNYLGTTLVFLLAWVLSYLVLDLLVTLLLKRIMTIIVLGPFDTVGGLLVGGFKGLLICGVLLQLVLALPISEDVRGMIKESNLSRFSISVYHWAFPYAKKLAPKLSSLTGLSLAKESGEEVAEPAEIDPDKFLGNISEYEEKIIELREKAKDLLKQQRLLLSVPEGKD